MVVDHGLDMRVISWFDSNGSWIISGKLLGWILDERRDRFDRLLVTGNGQFAKSYLNAFCQAHRNARWSVPNDQWRRMDTNRRLGMSVAIHPHQAFAPDIRFRTLARSIALVCHWQRKKGRRPLTRNEIISSQLGRPEEEKTNLGWWNRSFAAVDKLHGETFISRST